MPEAVHPNDTELVALFNEGLSQRELSRRLVLSPERIRQRLLRNGITGRNYRWIPDQEKLRAALLAASGAEDAAGRLGLEVHKIHALLAMPQFAELASEARAAWRARILDDAREERKETTLREIRTLALRLGHTPTQAELAEVGIHHAVIAKLWDSVPEAMREAGLIPNVNGRPPFALPPELASSSEPTEDSDELERRAAALLAFGSSVPVPTGNPNPTRIPSSSNTFRRDPKVVAWVRQEAGGFCEACEAPGYETDTGYPFLEVHHVIPLGDGGPDVPQNAVAVCETCHGKLHRWKHRDALVASLYERIGRLETRGSRASA